jgi:asparagine synthase (glutamine-hydrolysing)
VQLTVVDVEPDVRGLFEPIVRALDEPHADESAIPSWLISERVSEDYKVALAGTGGDELFAGYRRHAAFKWAQWYGALPARARRAASSMAALIPEPHGASLAVSRLKRFARSGGGTLADCYVDLLDRYPQSQVFTDDVLHLVEPSLAHATIARHYSSGPADGSVKSVLYVDYKTYLPDDLLHLTDRISMAHSLEVRIPFVDHALVDRLFPIPDRLRLRRGRLKHILREALRTRLPEGHFKAPKRGFVGPTALWLRHELREVLQDELIGSPIGALGFFRTDVVERLVHEHVTRRHNHEGVLWALLCFVSWYRIYGGRSPA